MAVVGLVLSTLTISSLPAAASNGLTHTKATAPTNTYVALGDSFSSGYGNPGPYLTQSGTHETAPDDGCNRTESAYPVRVSKWLKFNKSLPRMTFSFLACQGATTTDLWSGSPAVSDGLAYPASEDKQSGEEREGTQLVHTTDLLKARIVTLSIGGNDLSFPTVMETCVAAPVDCRSSSTSSSVADLYSNIQALKPVLVATYEQVDAEATNAAVYVVGYPDEVPPQPSLAEQTVGCGPFLLAGAAISYLAKAENNLNAVISQAATSAGVRYVNPNATSGPNSFVKHTVCSKSDWFQKIKFHPTRIGQSALAKDVEAEILKDSRPTSPPTVTGVSPMYGVAGVLDPPVTVTGSGFIGTTGVSFGATPALSFAVNSATSITAQPPIGTVRGPGYFNSVAVTVTTPQGTSAGGTPMFYTYYLND